MSSLPIEGTISAKPCVTPICHGTVSGSPPRMGTISGSSPRTGTVSGDVPESPANAAVAELGTLISSLGSLSAQAASLPLAPPTLPSLPQGGYQAQPTDYTQFCDDSN